MDYVDRLIQRALAVPRAQGSGVFDPFEVFAPWVVQPAADTARRVAPADHVAVAPVVVPMSIPAASPPSGEPMHVVPTEPPAQAMAPADAALARPAKVEPMRGVDPRPVPPVEPQAPTPVGLIRADAFMQALGVPPTVAAAPAAPRPAPMAPIDAVERPRDSTQRAAADAEPAVPMLLRPLPPRALAAAEAPVPSPRHRTSSPADERRPAPASPRAGHLPPAPQRIVQTTVVVAAPPSRRLDELAHSSAISRFGIGQG